MKIIIINTYASGVKGDRLLCENIDEYWGKRIVKFLNKNYPPNSDYFSKLVENDYKLNNLYEE